MEFQRRHLEDTADKAVLQREIQEFKRKEIASIEQNLKDFKKTLSLLEQHEASPDTTADIRTRIAEEEAKLAKCAAEQSTTKHNSRAAENSSGRRRVTFDGSSKPPRGEGTTRRVNSSVTDGQTTRGTSTAPAAVQATKLSNEKAVHPAKGEISLAD